MSADEKLISDGTLGLFSVVVILWPLSSLQERTTARSAFLMQESNLTRPRPFQANVVHTLNTPRHIIFELA